MRTSTDENHSNSQPEDEIWGPGSHEHSSAGPHTNPIAVVGSGRREEPSPETTLFSVDVAGLGRGKSAFTQCSLRSAY